MKRLVRAEGLLAFILTAVAAPAAQEPTRGVGVYPGAAGEDFAPSLVPDPGTYRNLALRRPTYHSSSYDYNLTAQLVTDGIKETRLPRWIVTTLSTTGVAPKNEREFLIDHNSTSNVNFGGPEGWVQFEMAGGDSPLEIDRIDLEARFRTNRTPGAAEQVQHPDKTDWSCMITGSDDAAL